MAAPSHDARLRDAGWTPGAGDIPALLELMRHEDDDVAIAAERALLRIESRQRQRIVDGAAARAREAVRPARGRLTRLLGRLAAESDEARGWLLDAVMDADPKTRRNAARALGKLPASAAIERALIAAWDAAAGDDDRRALAGPLGKVGSAAATARLAAATNGDKAVTRAILIAERGRARERERAGAGVAGASAAGAGEIDRSRAMEEPVVVRFVARAGLESIVADELGEEWRPRVAGPGVVEARLVGPLQRATEIRTAMHVAFPLDPEKIDGDLAEAIVRALLSPRARRIFATYTRSDLAAARFRLAWARGGPRRAVVWRCAELVRARSTELVNDPTRSAWEVVVDDDAGFVALELVPRGFTDDRFAYRERTVPASSHPTLAAALARIAPRSAEDVVWDPFAGAGAELVERARLGPYARLIGTDLDRGAIDAARANLHAAGITGAQLELASATICAPEGVNVIVTNPPMGRRLQRGQHGDLLERFVAHAAQVLVPGGTLVWTVPEPRSVHARAERAGLVLERSATVDMGGFPAALSVHRKR